MQNLTVQEVFENGRTWYSFDNREIPNQTLQAIYDLAKMGPTSANCQPLRIVFVKSKEEKEKLLPCLMEGNRPKSASASSIALFAYDEEFYKNFPQFFPANPSMGAVFENNPDFALTTAMRNSSLQAAYFMIAARSLGVDCGPMSGFDVDAINQNFFSGTKYKVNFICNLGYRSSDDNYPRLKRMDFADACKIV